MRERECMERRIIVDAKKKTEKGSEDRGCGTKVSWEKAKERKRKTWRGINKEDQREGRAKWAEWRNRILQELYENVTRDET